MSTVGATRDQSQTASLARLSPLVLVAAAMPWFLEWAIVEHSHNSRRLYEPLVTEGLADAVLYPAATGSVTLVGLCILLDSNARRSLFLFRRPTPRGLIAVVLAVLVGFVLSGLAQAVVIAVLGVDPASGTDMDFSIRSLVIFAVVGGVFAPIVKEVLFRGLLLGYLIERGVPTIVAAGVVVLAFGAIHYYGDPSHMVGAVVFGTIMVVLRLRYETIVVPVLDHSFNNLLVGMLLPFSSFRDEAEIAVPNGWKVVSRSS